MPRALISIPCFCLVLLAAPPLRAQPIEAVVAYVDDELIFASELMERLAELYEPEGVTDRAVREMLEHMIDEVLIRRTADRLGVFVSDEEVSGAMTAVRAQNGLDEEAFAQAFREQGIDIRDYEQELRRQLLHSKVLQLGMGVIEVGEDALRRAWRERVEGVPESDRLPFAEAREALARELRNARAREAEQRAMEELRAAAYISRRLALSSG